ncbi:MAG: hypothetical protein KIS92_17635 [Planctomycetota bacterium]|nr:hypothetical protein [Planctomycetota bacterium]
MTTGFGQLFKWSQRRNGHGPTVVAANYLVMAAAVGAYLLAQGGLHLTGPVTRLGALTGGFFIVAMIVMTRALETCDVGAVLTAFRLSILLPIVLGIWLWKEAVTALQFGGVGLALVGLAMMTFGARARKTGAIFSGGTLALLLLVFFSQSLSHVGLSSVHHLGLDGERLSLIFAISLTAGLLGAVAVAYKRHVPRAGECAIGALIGLYNLANLIVVLITLSMVPRAVFFPIVGCSVVIMDNLFAHFVWKERLRAPALIGAFISAAAMLMVCPR